MTEYECAGCGASGVRLYRMGGEFFRLAHAMCTGCAHIKVAGTATSISTYQIGFYIPLVVSPSGEPWGLTSIPDAQLKYWKGLPI